MIYQVKKGICIISGNCELESKSLCIFCLWAWGWGGGLGKWAGVGGRFRLIRILSKENVLFLTDSLPNWWWLGRGCSLLPLSPPIANVSQLVSVYHSLSSLFLVNIFISRPRPSQCVANLSVPSVMVSGPLTKSPLTIHEKSPISHTTNKSEWHDMCLVLFFFLENCDSIICGYFDL